MENSKLWVLNHKDWIKGLAMTILGAVLGLIYSALKNGSHINWEMVGTCALSSGIGYIIKQLGTGTDGNIVGTTAIVNKLGGK